MTLFAELKRRNVFRVGAAYVIISWLLLQVGEYQGSALAETAEPAGSGLASRTKINAMI